MEPNPLPNPRPRQLHESQGPLLIRADSSRDIGAGHALRCLALAQAWVDLGGRVVWVHGEMLPWTRGRIARESIELVTLPPRLVPWSEDDAGFTRSLAEGLGSAWIIIDDYRLNETAHRRLAAGPARLLRLVDHETRPLMPGEWILNQNLTEEAPESQHALLGTRYALLRREFRTIDHRQQVFPPVANRVLVTLGGSPEEHLVEFCASLFRDLARDEFPGLEVAFAGVDRLPSTPPPNDALKAIGAVDDMVSWMNWADLAVCAGGSTCWELCAARVPFLVMILAENQRENASRLDRAGCAVSLGEFAVADGPTWRARIRDLILDPGRRSRLSRNAGELVDGAGASRVCERLRSLAG